MLITNFSKIQDITCARINLEQLLPGQKKNNKKISPNDDFKTLPKSYDKLSLCTFNLCDMRVETYSYMGPLYREEAKNGKKPKGPARRTNGVFKFFHDKMAHVKHVKHVKG